RAGLHDADGRRRRRDRPAFSRRGAGRPHRAVHRACRHRRRGNRLAAPPRNDSRRLRPCPRGEVRRRPLFRICEGRLMFTGIVTAIGAVPAATPLPEGARLRIDTAYAPATIDIGASISCSGVCLTVVALPEVASNRRWFEVEAWEEALRLTTASG